MNKPNYLLCLLGLAVLSGCSSTPRNLTGPSAEGIQRLEGVWAADAAPGTPSDAATAYYQVSGSEGGLQITRVYNNDPDSRRFWEDQGDQGWHAKVYLDGTHLSGRVDYPTGSNTLSGATDAQYDQITLVEQRPEGPVTITLHRVD
jgi:hypothetical protein